MSLGSYAVRDLHIHATPRQLVRHVRNKLDPKVLGREHREERHKLYRDALAANEQAKEAMRYFRL